MHTHAYIHAPNWPKLVTVPLKRQYPCYHYNFGVFFWGGEGREGQRVVKGVNGKNKLT